METTEYKAELNVLFKFEKDFFVTINSKETTVLNIWIVYVLVINSRIASIAS